MGSKPTLLGRRRRPSRDRVDHEGEADRCCGAQRHQAEEGPDTPTQLRGGLRRLGDHDGADPGIGRGAGIGLAGVELLGQTLEHEVHRFDRLVGIGVGRDHHQHRGSVGGQTHCELHRAGLRQVRAHGSGVDDLLGHRREHLRRGVQPGEGVRGRLGFFSLATRWRSHQQRAPGGLVGRRDRLDDGIGDGHAHEQRRHHDVPPSPDDSDHREEVHCWVPRLHLLSRPGGQVTTEGSNRRVWSGSRPSRAECHLPPLRRCAANGAAPTAP